MIVDVSKLKKLSTQYNKIANDYSNNLISVLNIYSNIDKSWKDDDSKKFLIYTQDYKKDGIISRTNINYILEYYNKVIKMYSKFGNKINLNIEDLPNVINKLNGCKVILKTIITRLEYLVGISGTYRQNIEFILNKSNDILRRIEELCEDIRKSYKEITENERIMHHEFNLIDFKEIKGEFK